jgi:hypothetical protein
MAHEAHQSQQIMRAARQSLREQRAGGRRLRSIGRGSAELKARHYKGKLVRSVIALVGVVVGAMLLGTIVGGIGIEGLFYTVLLGMAAA